MSRGKWISLGVLGAELWRGSWGCCMVLLGNPESWRRSRREQTVRSALHPRVSTAPTDSPPSLAALGLSEIFPDCPEEPDADFRGGGQQTQLLRGQRSQQGRAAHCQEGEGRHQLSRANLPHFGYRCVDINVQCDRLLSGWVWWEVSGGCVGRAGIRPPKLRAGSEWVCIWGAGAEPVLVLTFCGFAQSPCALGTVLGCVCAVRELEP